jgi:hypothetical protein
MGTLAITQQRPDLLLSLAAPSDRRDALTHHLHHDYT